MKKQVEWISHRGESIDAPENTLSAFQLAMERDTDGIETDIHLTADGILVCIHDSDTGRVGNRDIHIESSTFAEAETLDVSNGKPEFKGEKIPTFRSVLNLLKPGKLFYVEVKENDERVLPAMLREIDAASVPHEQIVMISFHKEIVLASKRYMPDIKTLWLTGFEENNADGTFSPTPEETIAFLKSAKADGIDACALEKAFDAKYIKALKDAGYHVAIWTVDQEDAARRYLEHGVDSITSNCAAKLCKAIEGR